MDNRATVALQELGKQYKMSENSIVTVRHGGFERFRIWILREGNRLSMISNIGCRAQATGWKGAL